MRCDVRASEVIQRQCENGRKGGGEASRSAGWGQGGRVVEVAEVLAGRGRRASRVADVAIMSKRRTFPAYVHLTLPLSSLPLLLSRSLSSSSSPLTRGKGGSAGTSAAGWNDGQREKKSERVRWRRMRSMLDSVERRVRCGEERVLRFAGIAGR